MVKSGLRLLFIAATFLIFAAAPLSVRADSTKVTFLHTNDLYEISPKRGHGGLGQLMALIKAERAASPNTITTFGGDLISPSVMSGLTKGEQMIALMNAIGLDVAVPGNHEFDFGPEIALKRFGESKFTWLGTNLTDGSGKALAGTKSVMIKKVGDFNIGFFGLIAPETETLSSPGKGINFAPVIDSANAAVKQLQDMGADMIVALTHVDFATDRQLAKSVKGIHLILGGHDHEPITHYDRGVLIHKSGTDAQYLGVVEVSLEWIEKRGKKVLQVRPQWRMLSTAGVTPEAGIQAAIDGYNAKLNKELDVVIGTTNVELDSRRSSVRGGETTMGNLIAEAQRQSVGADVGLANGGGIRGDRTYDKGTKLTRKDVLTELPFGNVTLLLELSGADLLAALENGVSQVEKNAGRFPQVAGLTFVYDPKAAAGSRVLKVTVGGKALDKAHTYKVATNDYIAGGGDGYAVLKKGKRLIDASAATLMATTVMNYISAQGAVSPKVDGRIMAK